MHVNVIGAGLSGPIAAIALTRAGHKATVFERRHPSELDSYGVIGITEENCSLLLPLGVDLRPVALDNLYHEVTTGGMEVHRMSTQKFVVWADAHNVFVNAAEKAGITFKWETDGEPGDATVNASGLGFASKRGLSSRYAYMVFRGLSKSDTTFAWLSLNDPEKRFSFKLAHSPNGASWELYVHRTAENVFRSMNLSPESLPREADLLPDEFRLIVGNTFKLASSPISDWEVPVSMRHDGMVTVGDANGGMRPHTGMGANLGIRESLAVPELIRNTKMETPLLHARNAQRVRGVRMGEKVLGK